MCALLRGLSPFCALKVGFWHQDITMSGWFTSSDYTLLAKQRIHDSSSHDHRLNSHKRLCEPAGASDWSFIHRALTSSHITAQMASFTGFIITSHRLLFAQLLSKFRHSAPSHSLESLLKVLYCDMLGVESQFQSYNSNHIVSFSCWISAGKVLCSSVGERDYAWWGIPLIKFNFSY